MTVLSLWQIKGGAGKSTLTAQLGATISAAGYRTLLVDSDGQATLTESLQTSLSRRPTLRDVFDGQAPSEDALVPVRDNLHCIFADERLFNLEEELSFRQREYTLFADVLDPISNQFDICLIDLPAGPALISRCGLRRSDCYIMPILCGMPSFQSARKSGVQLARHAVKCPLGGVVLNMWKESESAHAVARLAEREWAGKVFAQRIAARESLQKMAFRGRTVIDGGVPSLRQDFANLSQEVLQHVQTLQRCNAAPPPRVT
jgi:cellulose biosynthesis protein BcsQ